MIYYLVIIAALAGLLTGWLLHRRGEKVRRQAVEAHWRETVKATQRARDRYRKESREASARMKRRLKEHEQCDSRIRRLERDVKKARKAHSGCDGQIQNLKARIRELEDQHAASVERLKAELAEARESHDAARAKLEREASAAKAKLTEMEQRRRERSTAVERMKLELGTARDAHSGCEDRMRDLEYRIGELQEMVLERDQALAEERPGWVLSSPKGERDDLQAIRGIGPILERSLNRLGIFHYRQIARLSPKDRYWVATQLSTIAGRIRRHRWVAQAKRLHFRKYGERP